MSSEWEIWAIKYKLAINPPDAHLFSQLLLISVTFYEAFIILLFSLDLVNSLFSCCSFSQLASFSTPKHYVLFLTLKCHTSASRGSSSPQILKRKSSVVTCGGPSSVRPRCLGWSLGGRNYEVQGCPPAWSTHQGSLSFENLPCPISLFKTSSKTVSHFFFLFLAV